MFRPYVSVPLAQFATLGNSEIGPDHYPGPHDAGLDPTATPVKSPKPALTQPYTVLSLIKAIWLSLRTGFAQIEPKLVAVSNLSSRPVSRAFHPLRLCPHAPAVKSLPHRAPHVAAAYRHPYGLDDNP